jgi:hypothetical protein
MVPFEVPFALPTEGLGIVETLEEHFEIMNLEVDIPEDYVGPLTGMDFANYADSRSFVADGSDRLYTVIFCLVDLSCYFLYVCLRRT